MQPTSDLRKHLLTQIEEIIQLLNARISTCFGKAIVFPPLIAEDDQSFSQLDVWQESVEKWQMLKVIADKIGTDVLLYLFTNCDHFDKSELSKIIHAITEEDEERGIIYHNINAPYFR